MAMEVGRMGTAWVCYGQMPALARLPEGNIVPAEQVKVLDVVPYTFNADAEDLSLEMTIHNSSREGQVLLGVIGHYPLDLTAADATVILNRRNTQKRRDIGHFPITSSQLQAKVLEGRWINARIEPLLYRNTMFPESVPSILSKYIKSSVSGASMTREAVTEKVIEIIAKQMKVPTGGITRESRLAEDLDMLTMDRLFVNATLDEIFGTDMQPSEKIFFKRVGEIVDYIMFRLSKAEGSNPSTIVHDMGGIGVVEVSQVNAPITREVVTEFVTDLAKDYSEGVINTSMFTAAVRKRFGVVIPGVNIKTVEESVEYILSHAVKPAAKASSELLIGSIGSVDVASMSKKDIEEKVKAIIAEYLGISTDRIASVSTLLKDLNADPGDVLLIFAKVQKAFGLDIKQEEVAIETVNDLVKYVIDNRNPS